jgi:hypothetical protein
MPVWWGRAQRFYEVSKTGDGFRPMLLMWKHIEKDISLSSER